MRKAQRGFTMIELMAAVAVFTVFATAAGGLLVEAYQSKRVVEEHDRELSECRAALAALESDLRSAVRVEVVDHGVDLLVHRGEVAERIEWRLAGDVLSRATGLDEPRVVARCIASFEVFARDALAHVALRVRGRSSSGRGATITTSVALRAKEQS